ncbi:MAG: hypothetical protein AAFX90_10235 [Pseudomonadota bacterium]
MAEKFNPSEEQIAKVLEKYTARQIAIAYLRASRRARQTETAFKALDAVSGAGFSAATGDKAGVMNGLDKLKKVLRSANETSEGQS